MRASAARQVRPERRLHDRFALKGSVILGVGGVVLPGRVANLSRGGLLVTTRVTAAERLLGRAARVELRRDGGDGGWLELAGTVRRIGATEVAIELAASPPSYVAMIDEWAAAARRHLRVLSLVLIDGTGERRLAMAEAFRATGCGVIDVATPLEAIVRLGEASFEPELIVIADSLPAITADELRAFVAREHPRATLVTIGDELVDPAPASAPEDAAPWLSSADPGDDLVARIRALLGAPPRR